jgi:hypothetical protein
MRQKETRKVVSKASILQNWKLAKEAKQKERSVVYYQDAIFTHDERIQQAVEALSFEPIPINSVFQK